jgi:hypothetical protein
MFRLEEPTGTPVSISPVLRPSWNSPGSRSPGSGTPASVSKFRDYRSDAPLRKAMAEQVGAEETREGSNHPSYFHIRNAVLVLRKLD